MKLRSRTERDRGNKKKKVFFLRSDDDDDDDVYYYIRWRLKLEGETENMGVCTKERKGVTAAVLMATPCTDSLGGESGGEKHEEEPGKVMMMMMFITIIG